jgi:hypothetical protein
MWNGPNDGVFTTDPDSSNANCPKAAYAELTRQSKSTALEHDAMATDSELQQAAMLVPTPLYFSEADTSD